MCFCATKTAAKQHLVNGSRVESGPRGDFALPYGYPIDQGSAPVDRTRRLRHSWTIEERVIALPRPTFQRWIATKGLPLDAGAVGKEED